MEELKENVDILEPEEKEFSLSGGSFFEEHPEKLLAEPYEASGRFGPVTKYRAKGGKKALDVLSEIDTPAFIAHGITDLSAGQSVIKTPDVTPTVDEDNNLSAAIETTKQNIVKRQKSEKRQLQEFEEPAAKPTIPFEDVLRTYNKNLSDDEIKAFLWYMHHITNRNVAAYVFMRHTPITHFIRKALPISKSYHRLYHLAVIILN